MRRFRQTSVVVLVVLLLAGLPAQARKLKVGVSGSPPFVIQANNSFQGISLDVWRQVAEDNELVYDLVPQSSPEAGIAAVDQGQIDVLVGPISITPRQGSISLSLTTSPRPESCSPSIHPRSSAA